MVCMCVNLPGLPTSSEAVATALEDSGGVRGKHRGGGWGRERQVTLLPPPFFLLSWGSAWALLHCGGRALGVNYSHSPPFASAIVLQ